MQVRTSSPGQGNIPAGLPLILLSRPKSDQRKGLEANN